MVQGPYDCLGVVVLVVSVAPGIPRNPTRRVQQQQQRAQSPHTSTDIVYVRTYVYQASYAYDTWYMYVGIVHTAAVELVV